MNAPTGRRHSRWAKFRYRFDAALARSPRAVIGWLALVTLAIIATAALTLTIARFRGVNGGPRLPLGEAMWQSLLRVVDAGTFAGDATWPTRIVGLLVSLSGIFLAGSLIGLIATSLDQHIERLGKGRSQVVEEDHTIVFGWSDRVPAVVRELSIANQSRKRAAVVVMATEDSEMMEEAIRTRVPDTMGTAVVCRTGDPSLVSNIELVNYADCRSVIIINGEGGTPATVKTLLAIRSVDPNHETAPIVAEVPDEELAETLQELLGDRLVTVQSDDIVAELTAQACRMPGLSSVFRELLDFDGDEIYFAAHRATVGQSFAHAQLSFRTSTLLGIRFADGRIELNPPAATVINDGDELIAIASDDSTFTHTGFVAGEMKSPSSAPVAEGAALSGRRRVVVIGWSSLGARLIGELDEVLDPEVTIDVVVDPHHSPVDDVRSALAERFHGETPVRPVNVGELSGGPQRIAEFAAQDGFEQVIVLGYREAMAADEADAQTLLTLLALDQLRRRRGGATGRMTAELLDQRHAPLAQASGADDFIVSDELTSLMIAQLAERHELSVVFEDLFDNDGCSIALVPAYRYGADSASTFADVVASASALGDTALGYRTAANGAVTVNPDKSQRLSLSVADEVLVLTTA